MKVKPDHGPASGQLLIRLDQDMFRKLDLAAAKKSAVTGFPVSRSALIRLLLRDSLALELGEAK